MTMRDYNHRIWTLQHQFQIAKNSVRSCLEEIQTTGDHSDHWELDLWNNTMFNLYRLLQKTQQRYMLFLMCHAHDCNKDRDATTAGPLYEYVSYQDPHSWVQHQDGSIGFVSKLLPDGCEVVYPIEEIDSGAHLYTTIKYNKSQASAQLRQLM